MRSDDDAAAILDRKTRGCAASRPAEYSFFSSSLELKIEYVQDGGRDGGRDDVDTILGPKYRRSACTLRRWDTKSSTSGTKEQEVAQPAEAETAERRSRRRRDAATEASLQGIL